MIEQLEHVDDGVVVTLSGAEPVRLTWRWLRDHGEDADSLDPDTLQRRVDTFSLPPQLRGRAEIADGGRSLTVTWHDGAPDTLCTASLLSGLAGRAATGDERRLWHGAADMGADTGKVSPAAFDHLMNDDLELARWLDEVHVRGFAIVEAMPATPEHATALAERISAPRATVFGTVWRLSSEMADHQDSAYSTTHLEPHTDGTYMADAPGTQLFCCVERSGSGGESVLVDGFAAAATLRTAHPEAFEVLTTVEVPARYVEPGTHLRACRPAIRLDSQAEVVQVSFNNYDRAPFWLPEPEMSAFYEAYGLLHGLVVDRSRWFDVRLEPGMALLFDNWRVLHGRHGYTGRRVFHGCYHNRDDIESKRRVLAGA